MLVCILMRDKRKAHRLFGWIRKGGRHWGDGGGETASEYIVWKKSTNKPSGYSSICWKNQNYS